MPKTIKNGTMPKWRAAPDELIQVFDRAMQSFPEAQRRLTFGYPSATVNGNMFAGLHQDKMILRLPEADRAELEQRGGKTFEPMPGRPMREFIVVPKSVLTSESQLNAWLKKSLAYARTFPPKQPKRRTQK